MERRTHQKQPWTFYHVSVFVLTFMGYAFFHATRKTFSNVKATMSSEWTPSFHNATVSELRPDNIWNSHDLFDNGDNAEYFLGALDTVFLFAYAVGLYISGIVGDRVNMRYILTFGMCSSALCVFMFGTVSEWAHIYSLPYYVIFWLLNGLLQSTGWPAMVAVMGNWFGKSSRGFILGLWSACASVGNIIGAFMVSGVLQYGYEYAFLFPSAVLFAGGIIIFFGLVPHPREVGLPEPSEELPTTSQVEVTVDEEDKGDQDPLLLATGYNPSEDVTAKKPRPAMGFLQALLLPGVILYSLSYACLKLVNYAFFFWLPFYLTQNFGWSQATSDQISIWYDVGGIVGGAIGGFVSDRIKFRSPVVIVSLICSFPALYGYSVSPDNKVINTVLMAIVGAFIGTPANLISSAISADMGRQKSLQDNSEALATVTGIVDGTGSVGAAIGQVLVPVIQLRLGWHWVFYFFMLMTFLTLVCVLPILWREVRSSVLWRRRFGQPGLSVNIERPQEPVERVYN